MPEKGRVQTLRRLQRKTGIRTLGFESSVSYEFYRRLRGLRAPTLRPVKGLVERLRAVKDEAEIGLIKEAVRRAEAAFMDVLPHIKAGVSERAIALRLEERLKKMGSKRLPFDIIVASGPNSAMPHAGVTQRRLRPGDLVIVDWGGEAGGYCSDITRTLLLKGPGGAEKQRIYALVLAAQKKAIGAVRPGANSKEIDNTARDIIKKAGYGKCFGHGLGHGVGLDVHELPTVSAARRGRLRQGMVFTVEPGIYLPGVGGVRIEDMVVVGEKSGLRLTSLPGRFLKRS